MLRPTHEAPPPHPGPGPHRARGGGASVAGEEEEQVIDQLLADVWAAAILIDAVILLTLGTLPVVAKWRPRKR